MRVTPKRGVLLTLTITSFCTSRCGVISTSYLLPQQRQTAFPSVVPSTQPRVRLARPSSLARVREHASKLEYAKSESVSLRIVALQLLASTCRTNTFMSHGESWGAMERSASVYLRDNSHIIAPTIARIQKASNIEFAILIPSMSLLHFTKNLILGTASKPRKPHHCSHGWIHLGLSLLVLPVFLFAPIII